LKAYFRKELGSKDTEIKDLKQQILELNNDVRGHIEKEQKLEEKLKALLESQEKLREMEQKVIAIGEDNNLIKNLSEIVKNRRR
jgi:predicted  nucleic acid-binding Zn-ribbon protein